MNTRITSEYIFIPRHELDKEPSPEEVEEIVQRMKSWFDRLTAEGKANAGQPLFHHGKIVSRKNGQSVTDGPFAETKEALADSSRLNLAGSTKPRRSKSSPA